MATRTIARLHDTCEDATGVFSKLEAAGIPESDISIVAHDSNTAGTTSKPAEHGAAAAAGGGAGIGTLVGGGAGLLAGLGTLATPGVGPVVAAGRRRRQPRRGPGLRRGRPPRRHKRERSRGDV